MAKNTFLIGTEKKLVGLSKTRFEEIHILRNLVLTTT